MHHPLCVKLSLQPDVQWPYLWLTRKGELAVFKPASVLLLPLIVTQLPGSPGLLVMGAAWNVISLWESALLHVQASRCKGIDA